MQKSLSGMVPASNCVITFIIGNGFDLGLNMKTSYEDMYEGYLMTPSQSKTIEQFKSDLEKRTPYSKWSDFEMGMAEYAKGLSSENELIECVRDFKTYMVDHLRNENDRINSLILDEAYAYGLVKELDRSLSEFHLGFTPNVIKQINQLRDSSYIVHNIITFNYTTVIESLFKAKLKTQKIIMDNPLHIHGSLDKDIVLGIDNVKQIDGISYNISRRGERAFIKPRFNEEYDNDRMLIAEQMIMKSNAICVYGFSFGESDQMWINVLKEWLMADSSHHLIVFQYEVKEYNQHNFDELMDAEESKKEELMKRLGIEDDLIYNQIHIPIGYDIFNFEFIKVSGTHPPKAMGLL